MIQENIFKQFETLYKIFISNKNFLLVSIMALVLLFIFIIFNHFSHKKIIKIITLVLYLGVLGVLGYFFHDEMFTFIDYLINNIFIFLFFPNLAVYTLIIIIANVMIIKSIFSKNGKIYKNLNALFFIVFNIIFYLIIDNIIKNKIDIYEQLSIYTNNNLLILIQVSMYVFILWLVILLINSIASRLTKTSTKEVIVNETVMPNQLVIENNNEVDVPNIEVTPNTLVVTEQEVNDIKLANNNIYNEYIDIVPIKKKENSLTNMDSLFTDSDINKDMDVVFGNKTYLNTIMEDIEKLKYNQHDSKQIKKIYESISLNSKDLTLSDYNYLIKALKEIKNNN